jgi:hypothetical protein
MHIRHYFTRPCTSEIIAAISTATVPVSLLKESLDAL